MGELLALTAGDIDFEQGMVVIRDSKTNDARRVPLAISTLDRLKPFKEDVASTPIISLRGERVAVSTASQAFRRLATRQKVGLKFHDLRHVAATRMLSKGAGLLQISTLLGHRTLSMARRYSHVQMDDLRKVMESIAEPASSPPQPAGNLEEENEPAKESQVRRN